MIANGFHFYAGSDTVIGAATEGTREHLRGQHSPAVISCRNCRGPISREIGGPVEKGLDAKDVDAEQYRPIPLPIPTAGGWNMALSVDRIERFVTDGYVKLEGAFPREVGERCLNELWDATGCSRQDPATWNEPVVRLGGFSTPPFREAANTSALHEAFDQLVGHGGWIAPGGLGTFPVRFPSESEPGDDGWHVEASHAGAQGEPRLDLRSHGRALLMLFLFSDIGDDDAPTRIRVGSHLDVPPLLESEGDNGRDWMELCQDAVPASQHRQETRATGTVGDVYLCHPFLVHAAQPHHGKNPRFMAQPPLQPTAPLDLTASDPSPVSRAVIEGLHRAAR